MKWFLSCELLIFYLGLCAVYSIWDILFLFLDPHNLGIRCKVNGELVQNSNTNQMIFKTEALIAWVSK